MDSKKQTAGSSPLLIVDDSDDDYEATVRALQRTGNLSNPIVRCEDGEETLDFLHQRGDHKDALRPALVLLDLNMPGLDGRSVLKAVKAEKALKSVPIIVMTTSDDMRDVEQCYELGANSYVRKPVDLDGFFDAIKRLKEFWFEIALIPKPEDHKII